MIYKKEANFPYPILSSTSLGYQDSDFTIKVSFEEDTDIYRFLITSNLTSDFINHLLSNNKAKYLLVIQSKDTKFFDLSKDNLKVEIPKSRMSLSNRTSIQLHVISNDAISFLFNNELSSFYNEMKGELVVPKYSLLGYSNIVTFEGGMKKPLELFEKKLNPNLSSSIKFEFGNETIIIHFRDEESQFNSMANKNSFLNPYLYTGLRFALEQFVQKYSEEDEFVDLLQITQPENLLDFKLYNLMISKSVVELNNENIDEVIARISNQIIEKYVRSIKELVNHEN